jgi:hypothetical protein
MHAVTVQGRWAWGVSGLLAAAALAIPGTRLIASEKSPWNTASPTAVTVRTVAVSQPVTSLLVQSYGGRVRVAAGQVSHVQVTERIVYEPKAGVPAVAESVSGGRLSLGDPACAQADCGVDFTVTVPSAVSVTVDTQGGPAIISAISGATGTTVDSGGGPVQVMQVTGPLTVRTGGGPLIMNDVAGPIRAGTSGGVLTARAVTARTASLSTGGGPAEVAFAAAPDTVDLGTDGGPVNLRLPGGPYALTADSDGGPELIQIATDPAARASIRVTSGGGPILVAGASGSGSIQMPSVPSLPSGPGDAG